MKLVLRPSSEGKVSVIPVEAMIDNRSLFSLMERMVDRWLGQAG